MTRKIIGPLVFIAALALPASNAFAWDGAKLLHNTCGADLVAKAAQGEWWGRVSDESGTLAETTAIPAKSYTTTNPFTMGGFSHDAGVHVVKYEVANAAGIHGPGGDGYVSFTQTQWNCSQSSIPGPPGPAGPAGPPGVNGKDSNSANSSTTVIKTIVVHEAADVCTSRRSYVFRVRRAYMGHRVVGVKAFEPGQHPKVTNRKGRKVISWSTKGQKFPKGGTLKNMGALAKLDNGKFVRLRYFYRPCASADGAPNDPSAAGQGNSGGGTEAAITSS